SPPQATRCSDDHLGHLTRVRESLGAPGQRHGRLQVAESFRGLLLLHRGRTGLIQRDLAARAGVSLRSLQDWEAGVSLPTAERLQSLIRALLEAGGLTPRQERAEARELWAAAEHDAPRLRGAFDDEWFVGLLAVRESSTPARRE